jgi:hypothetical protein
MAGSGIKVSNNLAQGREYAKDCVDVNSLRCGIKGKRRAGNPEGAKGP